MNISKYKIYVPQGSFSKPKSLLRANICSAELANYGCALSADAHKRIASLKPKAARKVVRDILKEYTVGELNQPLFNDWEDRTEFTFEEMVCQILGYVFQFSGNDLYDPDFMARLKENIGYKKAKRIELATEEEFKDYFSKLVNAAGTLDKTTSKKLEKIFDVFEDCIPELPKIKSAEIRIAASLSLSKKKNLRDCLDHLKCEPVDFLRYAAAKNDFQLFKLPSDVKYANLSWQERVQGFEYLNRFGFEKLCESMGINRGAWARFLTHTHFLGQNGFVTRFNNFYTAAVVSLGSKIESIDKRVPIKPYIQSGLVEVTESGTLAYRTFASRIMSAVENKDWPKIKSLCEKNKGYIFRNLMTVSNGIKKSEEKDFVDFLRDGIKDVSVSILFSILSIDVNAEYRVIDIKGNTVVEEANYPMFIQDLQGDIKRYIGSKYGYSGKVKASKAVRDNAVPFLVNNAELPRGTRIPVSGARFLYFFVHWVQGNRRTDLDHSFQCFNADWSHETVAFYRQANNYIAQSGDITNAPAPNGATEFGRISLNDIPNSVRYIAPSINVYCGDPFSDNKEARAGFFLSDDSRFSLSQKTTQYDLANPAKFNMPFVFDVGKQEIIVIDYNNRMGVHGSIADSYIQDVKKVILATNARNYLTIGGLAEILSGDKDEVSLKINNTNGTKPEELFSIFS